MYGLVNKAIEDLVRQQGGEGAWQRVAEEAGFGDRTFLSMEVYDDALTYRLVAAGAEALGKSPEKLLEELGFFWIRYTASEGYGELMDLFGSTLEEFLGNLDAMHARIGMSMSALDPPSFHFEPGADGKHLLHYRSGRPGLAPMVLGLLRGLAARFRTDVVVTLLPREPGADHDVFRIERRAG